MVFDDEHISEGDTRFKSSPPLRTRCNRKFLKQEVALRILDSIASYHMYVPVKYKAVDNGNFKRAFNGFNSVGLNLLYPWTLAYSKERKK